MGTPTRSPSPRTTPSAASPAARPSRSRTGPRGGGGATDEATAAAAAAGSPVPRAPDGDEPPSTRDRILDAALESFGTTGFDATSLDQIARELGVRKQTILYYFPSKPALLDAVVDRSAAEIAGVLEATLAGAGDGFDRIEAIVRSVFRVAMRRPELLGLLREVSRLGSPAAGRLVENFEPLVVRATSFLEIEMAAGRFRQGDARLLLVSVYSTIVGVATEVEVLRLVGIEPTLRSTAVRRREVINFLHAALVPDRPPAPTRQRRATKPATSARRTRPATGAPGARRSPTG